MTGWIKVWLTGCSGSVFVKLVFDWQMSERLWLDKVKKWSTVVPPTHSLQSAGVHTWNHQHWTAVCHCRSQGFNEPTGQLHLTEPFPLCGTVPSFSLLNTNWPQSFSVFTWLKTHLFKNIDQLPPPLKTQPCFLSFLSWGLHYETGSTRPGSVCSFTKPNKSDPAQRSQEAGCQLGKSGQVFLIYTWARSHKRGGVCSIWPSQTWTEQLVAAEQHVLNTRSK